MLRACCFTFVGLLLAALPTRAEVKLEWKFKENDKFQQDSTAILQQSMRVGGLTNMQDFEHRMQAAFSVNKVNPDGSVELRMELVKMKATNRATPGSPVASSQVRPLEDAVLTITLNAKKEVIKLEGYEDIVKRVTNDDPNSGKMIRDIIKEDTLRRSAEEAFGFLPDKPLNKGDKWERKLEHSLGPLGAIQATHTYTYEGPEPPKEGKELHKISVKSELSYVPPKSGNSGFQFQITKGELKTESASGTILFDAEAGRLVSSETKLRCRGTLTIAVQGQNHEFVIEQDQSTSIRVSGK
jgi:hypothetical protein